MYSLANLFFFTGENEYAVSSEIHRWKEGFRDKHGLENLLVFDGASVTLSAVLDAVETLPFIAEKRLVVIEGVPKFSREEMETLAESIHPQTVAVIVEPEPDKRLSAVKTLEKLAEVKRFPLLKHPELIAWMIAQATDGGAVMSAASASALLGIVGDDQRTLETEIRKLALYAFGRDITLQDIEAVSIPSGTQVIWKLTDLIGSGKSVDALKFLRNRLERGEDPYGMWSILLNMVKNLVLVHVAFSEGVKSERGIADAFSLHPMSVRGVMSLARSLPPAKVVRLLNWAADADQKLKSGGFHYSVDRPEELIALAERVILSCA